MEVSKYFDFFEKLNKGEFGSIKPTYTQMQFLYLLKNDKTLVDDVDSLIDNKESKSFFVT